MKTTDGLDPIIFVIFGGAGDLAWRKLIPALFDLSQDRSQPAQFAIIAVDRIKLSDGALRNRWHDGVNQFSRFGKAKTAAWNLFAQHIHYQQGDFKQASTYAALGGQCAKLEKEWGTKAQRIFYMATPPSMFGEIPKFLGKAGLARDREFARIVIEKPIGYDLESARALNAVLAASFDESQIFRIDHYLGKETVQNILAFRFANPIFEPIWNRRYIDYVTITVAETVGVEHRGGYYDHAGALRDMVQNHLMQLLCLAANSCRENPGTMCASLPPFRNKPMERPIQIPPSSRSPTAAASIPRGTLSAAIFCNWSGSECARPMIQ
jgi:glucose-6-phosphate 1-dehydrogenase